MKSRNRELKKDYQLDPRPMGIFQIRNAVSGKVLIGKSTDLPGIINRHRFELQMGGHMNKELQADWNRLGADAFAFEILDELTPRPEPDYNYAEDLSQLEAMWLDNLQPFDDRGYNSRPESRERKLWRIARNRIEKQDE